MSGSSSLNEKEEGWRLHHTAVADASTKEYEPIVSEPAETAAVGKDLEANVERRSTRGALSRLQSGTSGVSEISDELSETKSAASAKRKWYKKMNPLKWGKKPPIPETRIVCREYNAGLFSRLTFQWMNPLMRVSEILVVVRAAANAGMFPGGLQTTTGAQRPLDCKPG